MRKVSAAMAAGLLAFCAASCAYDRPYYEPAPQREATISTQEPTRVEEVERTEKTIPGPWEPKLK
jgi:hypothetical protein